MRKVFVSAALLFGLLAPPVSFGAECFGIITSAPTPIYEKPKKDSKTLVTVEPGRILIGMVSILGALQTGCAGDKKKGFRRVGLITTGGTLGKHGWVEDGTGELFTYNAPALLNFHHSYAALGAESRMAALRSRAVADAYMVMLETAGGLTVPVWETNNYNITYVLTGGSVVFELVNRSDAPIKVKWDECAFVDSSGESHRIIHEGVRLAERDQSMPPTLVPPGAKLTDSVIPTESVSRSKGGWVQAPLFPQGTNPDGAELGVLLAMEIAGETVYEHARLRVVGREELPD